MAIVANKGIIGAKADKPLGRKSTIGSRKSFAITPSDTVNLSRYPREIICGGAGTVAVVDVDDVVTSYSVVAGQSIPQIAKRINATGTTATPLVGQV